MSEIIDEATIQQLREMMGDDFSLLVDTFISDSTKRVEMIDAAISSQDAEALRTSAHSFKGSALNLSAATLTEACRQLEAMGKNRQLEGAEPIAIYVKGEFEKVKTYLQSL